MLRTVRPAVALAALLVLVSAASAQAAPLTTPCTGRAIAPDRVITGEFDTRFNKSFVMVPFEVPGGTTAIRVKYCWDVPESGSSRHTLDLGLYEPRGSGTQVWGPDEFRGWGGSSHRDVTLSAEGFSTEAEYTASPRIEPPGKTTRAFLPGPIQPGLWAAELGVAAVIPQSDGDADGKVGWRVEIEFAEDPAFADQPYQPAPYDSRAANRAPGWYAGDFHVHAEHSGYGDATMTETFGYAFRPVAQGGAGLDFITLSDYVGGSAWGEIGRYQSRHPGKLIVRSAEVITYRGHTNNHGSARFVDYREGPIFELQPNGSLKLVRGTRDPSELFGEVRAARRLDPDQPPDDLPAGEPGRGRAVPRLLLGVLRAGDRLLARGRLRDRHRARGHRRHAEPVHAHGDRRIRPPARPRPQVRRGRVERLPRRRQRHRAARRADRRGAHGAVREEAVRARHPLRDQARATPT